MTIACFIIIIFFCETYIKVLICNSKTKPKHLKLIYLKAMYMYI